MIFVPILLTVILGTVLTWAVATRFLHIAPPSKGALTSSKGINLAAFGAYILIGALFTVLHPTVPTAATYTIGLAILILWEKWRPAVKTSASSRRKWEIALIPLSAYLITTAWIAYFIR